MKAVDFRDYLNHIPIIHSDVEEVVNEMRCRKKYRCKCCGQTWEETINNPLIIDDEVAKNLSDYYADYAECSNPDKVISKRDYKAPQCVCDEIKR